MSAKRDRFRNLLERKSIIVAPGVYDCLGARIVDSIGFDAIYVTGFGTSTSLLGRPDLGFLTLSELVRTVGNIDSTTALPVIADAESGFGNALNVMRTVKEYERAGVAAIHIEDQIVPKKWKPDGAPQVTSAEEHCDRIRAAVEAREDEGFVIIGRTDAFGRYGLDEAVERGNAYTQAGAEVIFVHGVGKPEDLRVIAKEVEAPSIVNYSTITESGYEPPSVAELEEMGFKIVIFPGELLFNAARAMKDALLHLKSSGTMQGWLDRSMPIEEFRDLLEWSKYSGYEERWLAAPRSEDDLE